VNSVGVPLDKQGVPYTSIHPSLGSGEQLAGKIRSFSIGPRPVQPVRCVPVPLWMHAAEREWTGSMRPAYAEYSVSIPASERAYGQGADGSFSHFTVRTVGS
jgi:hypothetical protein